MGRLSERNDFWKKIINNYYILRIIQYGYNIPFIKLPTTKLLNNNCSGFCYRSFVDSEIGKLISSGCISSLNEPPVVVNPLSVAVGQNDKKRFILDGRHTNDLILKF